MSCSLKLPKDAKCASSCFISRLCCFVLSGLWRDTFMLRVATIWLFPPFVPQIYSQCQYMLSIQDLLSLHYCTWCWVLKSFNPQSVLWISSWYVLTKSSEAPEALESGICENHQRQGWTLHCKYSTTGVGPYRSRHRIQENKQTNKQRNKQLLRNKNGSPCKFERTQQDTKRGYLTMDIGGFLHGKPT